MKASVYNLTDKQQYFIKNPKFPDRGTAKSRKCLHNTLQKVEEIE